MIALFKIGTAAAVDATDAVVTELGKEALSHMLKEGGEETLEKGAMKLIRITLAEGHHEVEEEAIHKLANKVVSEGIEGREEVVNKIAHVFEASLKQSMYKKYSNLLLEPGLIALGEIPSGALGGGIEGVRKWDSAETVIENIYRVAELSMKSAIISPAGGFIMGNTMQFLGRLTEHLAKEANKVEETEIVGLTATGTAASMGTLKALTKTTTHKGSAVRY